MPKLSDYRDGYYEHSGRASDSARQLSFAGIALIWIFREPNGPALAVPSGLLLPAAFFVAALGLDLLQYFSAALIWSQFARHQERKFGADYDGEILAPRALNWAPLFCFWLKLIAVMVGYAIVLQYVYSLAQGEPTIAVWPAHSLG